MLIPVELLTQKQILKEFENFVEKNCLTEDDDRKFEWLCDMIEMYKEENGSR